MTVKPPVRVDLLSFRESGQFANRDIAYAEAEPTLLAFAAAAPTLEAFAKTISARRDQAVDRQALVEVVTTQYQTYKVTPPAALARLAESNTFTVVTAHQASLFLGPLYYVYKILSAVSLARQLNDRYPDTHVVPVFVLGAEDHDLEEIDHTFIESTRIHWDAQQNGATGAMQLDGISTALDEVAAALGDSYAAQQVVSILRKTYCADRSLGVATAAFVAELFVDYGVVVVNLNDRRFKQAFAQDIAREILGQESRALVEATQTELHAAGFAAQAYVREINFFYLQDGRRDRIERDTEGFRIVDTRLHFSEAEMCAEIEAHPERFSPNVVMRPLLQERCLPNLAYVGGGGELAYWLERRRQFAHFGLPFPILVRRDSAWWIEATAVRRLDKLGLRPADLLGDPDALLRRYVKHHHECDLNFATVSAQINGLLTDVSERAASVDPTLRQRPLATAAYVENRLADLETRLVRLLKRKHEREVTLIRSLAQDLVPNGGLQERRESFLPLYVRYGKAFFDVLLEHFDPLDMRLKVFTEVPAGSLPSRHAEG